MRFPLERVVSSKPGVLRCKVLFEYDPLLPDMWVASEIDGKTRCLPLYKSVKHQRLQGRQILRKLFKKDIVPPPFPDE